MNLVIGARGRLGSSICSSLPAEVTIIPARSVYSEWWRNDGIDAVSRYLESLDGAAGTIYMATGIIDPRSSHEDHYRVNYLLARNIVEGATKLGFRVVTFGTVMEEIVSKKTENPYFASKIRIGDFVREYSGKSNLALHIRLHTLFGGGLPDSFMFLGQIFKSLVSRSEFKMSSGEQLREYHHLEDEVLAISKILETNVSGCINLTHGEPVSLKELASYIFESFNCSELLKIGELPNPIGDNYSVVFKRTEGIEARMFRNSLPALTNYLRVHLQNSGLVKV